MRPAFGIGSGTLYEAATWESNVAATLANAGPPAAFPFFHCNPLPPLVIHDSKITCFAVEATLHLGQP